MKFMNLVTQFDPHSHYRFFNNLKYFKMKGNILFFLLCIGSFSLNAQVYDDYIGAGHSEGITVMTSHNVSGTSGENTINGNGMDARLFEASRFLSQATFGFNKEEIEDLAEDLDFEAWIDAQFDLPVTEYESKLWAIWDTISTGYIEAGVPEEDLFGPWQVHFNYTWWQNTIDGEDQLRQRVAFALSQILVTSSNSDLSSWGWAMAHYWDILMEHSFGNYQDLMSDVSLSTIMGYYLSHLNNPREIPEENIHPDENYAREIMQLFSIGLYELNQDGTRKQDADGDDIPTYDNDDIKELAKVFTGLYPGALEPWVDWADEPYFGLGIYGADKTVAMQMDEGWHEPGEKVLLKTHTIPAGQPGMDDIDEAVEFLFNHENVAPFLAYRMIQRFVKSNPSPAYVERVADAFNDNGEGVRGDMKAFMKAILLDEEARTCEGIDMLNSGKLKEPTIKMSMVLKALPMDAPMGRFWNNGFQLYEDTRHHPYMSPTVFNFYLPDHLPVGQMALDGVVSPEMKLHNTQTATNHINMVNSWTNWDNMFWDWEDDEIFGPGNVTMISDEYEEIADDDLEALIHEYDILFSHGQLTDEMRTIIRDSINGLLWGDVNYDRARLGLYLLLISPDFNITK